MRLEAMANDTAGKPPKITNKLPTVPKAPGLGAIKKPSLKMPTAPRAKIDKGPKAPPIKALTTKKRK